MFYASRPNGTLKICGWVAYFACLSSFYALFKIFTQYKVKLFTHVYHLKNTFFRIHLNLLHQTIGTYKAKHLPFDTPPKTTFLSHILNCKCAYLSKQSVLAASTLHFYNPPRCYWYASRIYAISFSASRFSRSSWDQTI